LDSTGKKQEQEDLPAHTLKFQEKMAKQHLLLLYLFTI